jgi:hypothetical protein
MVMKGNVTRSTQRRTTTRRALHRLVGLARAGTILIRGLAAAALAAALTPSIGLSQERAPFDDLRQEWRAVQMDGSQQARKTFWQGLDPDQLNSHIEAGAEVTLADRRGWTPLHSAARYSRDPEVLAVLLEAGADVNARDKAGDTPLHWAAAESTSTAVINALLQSGAAVNARDRYGWLPIHTAADRNPNPDIIDALLKAGANPNKRAYFVLFRPVFLLKHNANMSPKDKGVALSLLTETE